MQHSNNKNSLTPEFTFKEEDEPVHKSVEDNVSKSLNTVTEFELHPTDCIAGMKSMPDESVDLIVTSPPYNLNVAYNRYQDDQTRDEYLEWSYRWASEAKRVLKPNGSFFLNIGSSPSNPMLPHELLLKLRSLFMLQNTIHWIKSITVNTKRGEVISAGHFKPINSPRFLTDCHEFIFHLTKTKSVKMDRLAVGVEYSDKSNIKRWGHTGGQDKRCRGNNWFIPYQTIQNRTSERPHPATFPVELVSRCIKLHGIQPDLTMLEPFLGIGSSALAAKECGVKRFVGFEIDESYLQEARMRIGLEPLKS